MMKQVDSKGYRVGDGIHSMRELSLPCSYVTCDVANLFGPSPSPNLELHNSFDARDAHAQ